MSQRVTQVAVGRDIRHTDVRSFVSLMRRFAVISAPLLLLLACTQPTLAPEEVFGRATTAIRGFTSADFTVHARSSYEDETLWSADIDGRMASGGTQISFHANAAMFEAGSRAASFEGDVVIPSEGEVYLKADSLALGQGLSPFLSVITGTWWKLPETGSGASKNALTPDPSLLSMQMETVTLTKDHGTERINQRLAYKYDVTMDQEKLLAYLEKTERAKGTTFDRVEWQNYLNMRTINGTVWIDAETFLPDKLLWTIVSTDPDEPNTIDLDVTFANHNKAVSIVPPATSSPFPIGTGDLQQLLAPGDDSDLTLPSLP